MTRSTASHALAILILGASISTGILAAPVHSPMTPSSMGALTGAQGLSSQSSSNGLGQRPLCECHSPELVRANLVVPRRESELGLTSDDLAMYEPKDGVDHCFLLHPLLAHLSICHPRSTSPRTLETYLHPGRT
ncbi:hypothetical protein FB446DRAFT_260758 [Lentinula raphanica]|nr:hypothetical protein FB446DRAFT_260758 [Lentinula raphanica]